MEAKSKRPAPKSHKTYRDQFISKDFIECSKPLGLEASHSILWGLISKTPGLSEKVIALAELKEKQECPECQKSYYAICYRHMRCVLDQEMVPRVELPLEMLVYRHSMELISKSSAVPLSFLSPQVKIQTFPEDVEEIRKVVRQEGTWILYPHASARSVEELSEKERGEVRRLVAIDCTWHQTKAMLESLSENKKDALTDPSLRFFKLGKEYLTTYWRFQYNGPSCLSSVEAIYYAVKELFPELDGAEGLLFFYVAQFCKMYAEKSESEKVGRNKNYFMAGRVKTETKTKAEGPAPDQPTPASDPNEDSK